MVSFEIANICKLESELDCSFQWFLMQFEHFEIHTIASTLYSTSKWPVSIRSIYSLKSIWSFQFVIF